MTIEEFKDAFNARPHPDDVGQSEYRLIWDHIDGMLEAGEDVELIEASIDELAETVGVFKDIFGLKIQMKE